MKHLKYLTLIILLFAFNNSSAYSISSSQGTNVCFGQATTLTLHGSLGDLVQGNSITWYSSQPNINTQCATQIGYGTYFVINVTGTVTIWCKPACGTSNTGSLVSITLTAKPIPGTPTATQNGAILHSSSTIGNQWYNSNGLINGAINQDFNPTMNGNYYVISTNNGCSSGVSNTLNYNVLGVSNLEIKSKMKIYPNPVKDILHIDNMDYTPSKIYIYDNVGKLIQTGKITNNKVDLSSISSGTYFIKIQDSENSFFKYKLLKE